MFFIVQGTQTPYAYITGRVDEEIYSGGVFKTCKEVKIPFVCTHIYYDMCIASMCTVVKCATYIFIHHICIHQTNISVALQCCVTRSSVLFRNIACTTSYISSRCLHAYDLNCIYNCEYAMNIMIRVQNGQRT